MLIFYSKRRNTVFTAEKIFDKCAKSINGQINILQTFKDEIKTIQIKMP